MARTNRVDPFGRIVATAERGTRLGNRGILHDSNGRIRRPWAVRRWLICSLEFRGRRRTVMAPNRYTELFFLDEATALAAGHRPCFECRRRDFHAFRDAWSLGNPRLLDGRVATADLMDAALHAERVGPGLSNRTYRAGLDDLPDGVFVTCERWGEVPHLVRAGHLLAWSFGGYGESRRRPRGEAVTVLTPASTVAAIGAGYAPAIHPSAERT